MGVGFLWGWDGAENSLLSEKNWKIWNCGWVEGEMQEGKRSWDTRMFFL